MSKYVRDTAAAKSISACVILNRKGAEVATVNVHFSNGGRCLVNVWQRSAACERSAVAAAKAAAKEKAKKPAPSAEDFRFQVASANGYGYDKFTAALRGMYIDGHLMTDHCSRYGAPKPPKGRKLYPRDFKTPKGYSLANYADGAATYSDGSRRYPGIPETESGYDSCYRESGLKFLEKLGYQVFQAI